MRLVLATLCSILLLSGIAAVVARISLRRASVVWLALYLAIAGAGVAASTTHSFLARWGIKNDVKRDGLWSMMDGTADRPFVFRRLAPDVVALATDATEALVPPRLVDSVAAKTFLVERFGVVSWERRKVIALHWATLFVWACYVATIVAGAALLRSVTTISRFAALVAATSAVGLLPLTMSAVAGYIYDAPELLIWTLALTAILRGRHAWLLLLFPLLALNKETAVVAVPVLFVMLQPRCGWRVASWWSAGLVLVGVAWLVFVRARYAGNPGEAQFFKLLGNLEFWANPTSYLKVAPLFGPGVFVPRGANVLILLFLLLPLRFGWAQLPSAFARAMLVCAAVTIPLFLVSGAIDETRALALLFPFLFVAVVCGALALASEDSVAGSGPA